MGQCFAKNSDNLRARDTPDIWLGSSKKPPDDPSPSPDSSHSNEYVSADSDFVLHLEEGAPPSAVHDRLYRFDPVHDVNHVDDVVSDIRLHGRSSFRPFPLPESNPLPHTANVCPDNTPNSILPPTVQVSSEPCCQPRSREIIHDSTPSGPGVHHLQMLKMNLIKIGVQLEIVNKKLSELSLQLANFSYDTARFLDETELFIGAPDSLYDSPVRSPLDSSLQHLLSEKESTEDKSSPVRADTPLLASSCAGSLLMTRSLSLPKPQ